jgi:hypothetical protein
LLLDILKLKSTHKTEKTAVLGRPTAFPIKSVEERNADRVRLKNGIEKEKNMSIVGTARSLSLWSWHFGF